jgi:hypothetical protein
MLKPLIILVQLMTLMLSQKRKRKAHLLKKPRRRVKENYLRLRR